jgi:hypothetical protein
MKWSVKLRGVKLGGEAHFTGTEAVRAQISEPNVVRTWQGPKMQKALLAAFTLEYPVS